eukprot:gene32245-16811_t
MVGGAIAAAGFGAEGIAAGSTAAGMMSAYGGAVPAGGIVAFLQSAGAAGLGAGATAATSLVGAMAFGAVAGVVGESISVDAGGLREDELTFVGKAAFKTHHGVFVTVFPFGFIRGQARKILPWEWVSVFFVESLGCFALKSHLGKWLSATPGGSLQFRDKVREWELFHVEIPEGSEKACIRSIHGKFLCAEQNGWIVANRDEALDFEMFEIHWQSGPRF